MLFCLFVDLFVCFTFGENFFLSDVPPEIIVKPSLTAVMEAISGPEFINKIENVFIIGGYSVYKVS